MTKGYVIYTFPIEQKDIVENSRKKLFRFGGKGSGNFDHVGRPGMVGGSGKGESSMEVKPLKDRKKYYFHRSTTGKTDDILSSGFIKGSYDNFGPQFYKGAMGLSEDVPSVFFGIERDKLQEHKHLFQGPVASNIGDTPLSEMKILIHDPENEGTYYDVTSFYNQGVRTETELVKIYEEWMYDL